VLSKDEARRIRGLYRQAAGATEHAVEAALFVFRLQHLARFWVDEMNPSAGGACHRLVGVPADKIIGGPTLHLLAGSWAAVGKWNHGGMNDASPADV
jgi:hypothetical protein